MGSTWRIIVIACTFAGSAVVAMAATPGPDTPAAKQEAEHLDKLPALPPQPAGRIDPSGRKEKGRASYYGKSFDHKKMADGRRMDPHASIAASKTLPLGTLAKVTNLQNGKTATVRIEDRGPYVKGRVVDLSPAVADRLDIKKEGVAPVVVKPITVPQPDGAVKLGAGAAGMSPTEIVRADDETKSLVQSKPTEQSKQ
jgi:rare lipoprotein A